jgi:hypothetical protein
MKVDVYKRPDHEDRFAYLAVPEGKPIPHEATNVDWETDQRNIDFDDTHQPVDGLTAEDAMQQIDEKGYAITHSYNNNHAPRPRA